MLRPTKVVPRLSEPRIDLDLIEQVRRAKLLRAIAAETVRVER